MNVCWWFNNENLYFEFVYVYAIYIQEPNSTNDMNVTTWALHCIVLCQSFLLFNKYWRTQIPFYFSRVLLLLLDSGNSFCYFSSHTTSSVLVRLLNTGKTKGKAKSIWQILLLEANVLKEKQKKRPFYFKEQFWNEIKKACSFVVRWKRKHKCFLYLWMKLGNLFHFFSIFVHIGLKFSALISLHS